MKLVKIVFILLIPIFVISCKSKDHSGEIAKAEYDKSLNDSIESIKGEIDSCNNQIGFLREKINDWLKDFTTVNNPAEAAPYIILTSAKKDYPLKSTGITARLNDSGQLEIIAALTGKPFDCISVTAGGHSATSQIVPNDQALNYRTASLTTVSFTGNKADSIGMLIAGNRTSPLLLTFLNNGKTVNSYNINQNESNTLAMTYLFYKDNADLKILERKVPLLHEKINLIRLHLNKQTSREDLK